MAADGQAGRKKTARRRLNPGLKGWEAALLHGLAFGGDGPNKADASVSDEWFLLSPHQGRRGPWDAHDH